MVDITQLLQQLLTKNNQCYGKRHRILHSKSSNRFSLLATLYFCSISNYETAVLANASSYKLGAVLLQQQPLGHSKPVTKYQDYDHYWGALCTNWKGSDSFHLGLWIFNGLLGSIKVWYTYRPLFSSKQLEVLPLRVQIFRLTMLHCEYSISHVPGKQLVIADTFSWTPAGIIL